MEVIAASNIYTTIGELPIGHACVHNNKLLVITEIVRSGKTSRKPGVYVRQLDALGRMIGIREPIPTNQLVIKL